MQKAYARINWQNSPSTATPLGESKLLPMDASIDEIDNRVVTFDTTKANQSDLLGCLSNVTYNESTGVFVFTWKNGNTLTADLNIEKIPVNFSMSAAGVITMTTSDGTTYTADVSELIKTYTFIDSSEIDFTEVTDEHGNKRIMASLVEGSISGSKLYPNYLADCQAAVSNSSANATLAQSWAVGGTNTRTGEDTNNAEYWCEMARQASGDGHTIIDSEGTLMTNRSGLQFTGDVSVTDNSEGDKTVVNISGGGHTIENPSGTDMTQRTNLQFADAHLTDDSVNDRTEVENIKDITSADYASATEDGFYFVTDESDEELTADDIAFDSDHSIKEKIDELDASNAGAHNSIYRGKYLGTSVTADQYSAISAGTFDDLYIGDYWTIGGVNYRIAAFDYWLGTGDTECTTHHVVIVPDVSLATAKMNDTATTVGGYVGSDFYTGNNSNTGLATAKTKINSAFGSSHVLSHRDQLSNSITGNAANGWAWKDSAVELMNETMIYGHEVNSEKVDGYLNYNVGVDKTQLPLFAHNPSAISNREVWWLRSIASSARFSHVDVTGAAYITNATYDGSVRPVFAIMA